MTEEYTMQIKKLSAAAIGAVLAITGVGAAAHHSFATEFDRNKPVRLEGKVVMFEWVNPHSWIHIDAQRNGRADDDVQQLGAVRLEPAVALAVDQVGEGIPGGIRHQQQGPRHAAIARKRHGRRHPDEGERGAGKVITLQPGIWCGGLRNNDVVNHDALLGGDAIY